MCITEDYIASGDGTHIDIGSNELSVTPRQQAMLADDENL